jgi:cytochrome c peroxidase
MRETVLWPAKPARLWYLGLALAVFGLSTADSSAAQTDRAARMATFVRPKSVPFPPANPFSPEKVELGRMLFFDPLLTSCRR